MAAYNQVLVSPGAQYLGNGIYTPQDDRRPWKDFAGVGSPSLNNSGLECAPVGGSTLQVNIGPGVAYVIGDIASTDIGAYRIYNSSTRTVACPTAHGTNPRLDQVILRVLEDEFDGSGFTETRFELIPGTATAGASHANRNGAANLTSLAETSNAVYLLADVLVPAAATNLVPGDIMDRRIPLIGTKKLTKVGVTLVTPLLSILTQNLGLQPILNALPEIENDEERVEVLLSLEEASPAAPGQYWRLMFIGLGSNNNWSFIGGPDLYAEVLTSQTTTSASYADLTTAGPSITIPTAGIYEISFGADLFTGTAGTQTIMSPKIGGAATADADGVENRNANRAGVSRFIRKTCAAGDLIKCQYKSNGTATLTAANRWLRIRPISLN